MLAGRDAERAAVAALLDGARTGAGGALVVRGVAGVGKSSLLTEIAAGAADLLVVRTSGVESESPLAFAALQRLLWPLRAHLAGLPAPQRDALAVALGEASGDRERFLAFLGTLSLLADAAEDRPVLAVVDDAQWLDDASAAALLFVARRLQAERVALVFAARDGDARRFDAPDLPTVALGGVAGPDADVLLASSADAEVDPAVRDRLVAETGGNPLALIELAAVLDADQLAGRVPLPTRLPLTGGVERGFLERWRRLSPAAQQWLLAAAADDTGRLTVVRDAAERLGADDSALDEVERSGLVRVDGDGLDLYHPLVRSAVYRAATSAQRRTAHQALASALATDLDRRAWHLAAAADRPDDSVVAELDGVAERAAARGGHEAAAAAWARAAELTAAGEERGRRLYLAASSAWLGAHPSRATALAAAASAEVRDPRLRARLLTLQGTIEWNTRSLNDGYDLVLQAAETVAGVDEDLAQQLTMLAASLAAFGAHSPRRFDPFALVRRPADDTPAPARISYELLRGFRALSDGDPAAAAASFDAAFALAEEQTVEDHVVQPNLAVAAWALDDDERTMRLHEQQLTAARRVGALTMVEHALTRGFFGHLATGGWSRAAADAAEALPLAASTGHRGMTAIATAELALIGALRGDASADRLVEEADGIRAAHPVGITDGLVVDLLHWSRGLRAAAQPATALHRLEQIGGSRIRRMAAPDLFEAAVRAGRPDVAQPWIAELEELAVGAGVASARALVEHGLALLAGDAADAEAHFVAAVEAHRESPRLPHRARTHLAYGEYLRRSRRRVDAREHLRAALALFEDLGAAPWAERAAQELRASGETARRRDAVTASELTAQERQVASLVRQGLSNRDVAAQLFVSPRTVDFHLRNIFVKLAVTSRAELTALPLDL